MEEELFSVLKDGSEYRPSFSGTEDKPQWSGKGSHTRWRESYRVVDHLDFVLHLSVDPGWFSCCPWPLIPGWCSTALICWMPDWGKHAETFWGLVPAKELWRMIFSVQLIQQRMFLLMTWWSRSPLAVNRHSTVTQGQVTKYKWDTSVVLILKNNCYTHVQFI